MYTVSYYGKNETGTELEERARAAHHMDGRGIIILSLPDGEGGTEPNTLYSASSAMMVLQAAKIPFENNLADLAQKILDLKLSEMAEPAEEN